MIQRANAACKIQRQENDMRNYLSEVRADQSIQTWANREISSTVIVQGSSQSTDRLCHFSCDIVNHLLDQQYVTVYMLNNADIREYFERLGADELLRQISCQLLRATTAAMPISLLAGILPHFQNATTAKDYFDILELLMQKLTSLFIVIDASVMQAQAKMADLWVAEFDAMFDRLRQKSNVLTKVMILSNRQLESPSDKILYVNIGSNDDKDIRYSTSRPIQRQEPSIQHLPFFIPKIPQDKYENEVKRPRANNSDVGDGSETSKK